MLDVPPPMLEERRRLGLDVFDEVWEGVLHMVPPPSGNHQFVGTELTLAISAAAKRRGLVLTYETGLFAADDDYRVPDVIVSRPEQRTRRGVDGTAALVVELLSPGDETYDKVPWYAARHVDDILVIDPDSRRVELYSGRSGVPPRVATDHDGGLLLATLDAHLGTVDTDDGPRLRIDVDGTVTDC